MSALPFRAEDTLTASSGADVPKATMVSPMTMLGMWNRLATYRRSAVGQAVGAQQDEEETSDEEEYIHDESII